MFTVPAIKPTQNAALSKDLTDRINYKTKPLGSLGRLESLAHQIGLIQQTTHPVLTDPCIIVFAADHGIVDEKISAFPQDVTWQMVENFLAEGAAINVFARQNQIHLKIVDAGVKHDFGVRDKLIDRKVAYGTENFAKQPAMTAQQCQTAMQYGYALVSNLSGNVLGFGEMGIGNTTTAATLMHLFTGIPVAQCVGAGTGLDAAGILHKQNVIQAALEFHDINQSTLEKQQQSGQQSGQPWDEALVLQLLAEFGGFEIAMMAGSMLAAAERGMVILIDGFIVSSAYLVALRLRPDISDYAVFSHQSNESGHSRMLAAMHADPVLQLDLRLGEGTGAALVYPVLQAAVNFLAQMATFGSAQVSEKSAD